MGSICRASVGESLAKYVGESAKGSALYSGEIYLQFPFSLLVAGLD